MYYPCWRNLRTLAQSVRVKVLLLSYSYYTRLLTQTNKQTKPILIYIEEARVMDTSKMRLKMHF